VDRDTAGGLRRAIVRVEKARLDAMVAADLAALGGYLHDSLSYVHSTGRCDTKESLLQFISGGTVRYLEIEHDLGAVRETEVGLAVVCGTMRMRLVAGGVEKSLNTRTTNLWVSSRSLWGLVAFHATLLPGSQADAS
jgi:hypothetical protein